MTGKFHPVQILLWQYCISLVANSGELGHYTMWHQTVLSWAFIHVKWRPKFSPARSFPTTLAPSSQESTTWSSPFSRGLVAAHKILLVFYTDSLYYRRSAACVLGQWSRLVPSLFSFWSREFSHYLNMDGIWRTLLRHHLSKVGCQISCLGPSWWITFWNCWGELGSQRVYSFSLVFSSVVEPRFFFRKDQAGFAESNSALDFLFAGLTEDCLVANCQGK